jgi:tetratricopeptide (TPR) repeat protein
MSAQITEWLAKGIAAAKAGNDAAARELLSHVVDQDPQNEQAWLWLASVVQTDEELEICLENVLTINPANEAARARLAMLSSLQAPAPAAEPEPEAQMALTDFYAPVAETESVSQSLFEVEDFEAGCPYCGKAVDPNGKVCPHCRGRLLIEQPKAGPFPGRIWLLTASWGMMALIYALLDWLIVIGIGAMLATDELGQPLVTFTTTAFKSYVVNLNRDIDIAILPMVLWVLLAGEIIAIGWSVIAMFITPMRRSAVTWVSAIIISFNTLLMMAQIVLGVYVSLLKLVTTLAMGFFLFTSLGDFVWEKMRYTLALETGLKTALDYYNCGRRYRERGMLANAALHWQRAVLIEPDRVPFRIALGNVLYKLERYPQAAEHIRAALQRTPPPSANAEELGQFLELIESKLDAS